MIDAEEGKKRVYIFLDIDGTISSSVHTIEPEVALYLNEISSRGFILVFVTGRSYQWALDSLKFLRSPYLFSWQNGAVVAAIPSGEILYKKYIGKSAILITDKIAEEHSEDYVIYTGIENDSRCYFRKPLAATDKGKQLLERASSIGEEWIAVDSFHDLPVDSFPAIKFFGREASLQKISKEVATCAGLHIPVIADPVIKGSFVAQGTLTNKGDVVGVVKKIKGEGSVIAAGDDRNDFDMLMKADIRVAVATAPEELLAISDIQCGPASESGIVEGLKMALRRLETS